MTVACIVQARLGSTRLPAKVLLPLPTGRTVIEEVLFRCKQIPGIDVVVCAIPDTAENDILAHHVSAMTSWRRVRGKTLPPAFDGPYEHYDVTLVRGPEHDVLVRYVKAAEAVGAHVIMRVTADCPMLDPQVCGDLLKLQQRQAAGYASNAWPARSFPHGFDCEVFTRGALEMADYALPPLYETVPMPGGGLVGRDNQLGADREHAGCPWMQREPVLKKAFLKSLVDRSHLRWTLDTLEDYKVIWRVMEEQMREAA